MNKFPTHKILYIAVLLAVTSCTAMKKISLEPAGYDQLKSVTIENGDLKAVFIDNTELPPNHRAGYNGIAELYHTDQDSSLFVPYYAGFNLEHIFSGDSLTEFFEPRVNPMTLYRKSETEVLLYQKSTRISGVESLTEFKLVPPCYIDITFRCVLHNKPYFKHSYAGFFWASYINMPPDRNIYFRGITENMPNETWISAFSENHGSKSTHRAVNDRYNFYFAPDFRIILARNFSNYHYSQPFYYGRFHNMALAFFFESSEVIRLTQSPSGGGKTNPAWDFQYLIPNPKTGREYNFKVRMVYKLFAGNQDILEEYRKWVKQATINTAK
jgi:hypothetical protein